MAGLTRWPLGVARAEQASATVPSASCLTLRFDIGPLMEPASYALGVVDVM